MNVLIDHRTGDGTDLLTTMPNYVKVFTHPERYISVD